MRIELIYNTICLLKEKHATHERISPFLYFYKVIKSYQTCKE